MKVKGVQEILHVLRLHLKCSVNMGLGPDGWNKMVCMVYFKLIIEHDYSSEELHVFGNVCCSW